MALIIQFFIHGQSFVYGHNSKLVCSGLGAQQRLYLLFMSVEWEQIFQEARTNIRIG